MKQIMAKRCFLTPAVGRGLIDLDSMFSTFESQMVIIEAIERNEGNGPRCRAGWMLCSCCTDTTLDFV